MASQAERRRAWYERNREKAKAQAVAWNRANRERRREIVRKSDKKHREKRLAARRAHAQTEEYKERRRVYHAEWRAKNPDKVRKYAWRSNQKRRDFRADKGAQEYAEILRGDPCCYCGDPMDDIEHIDPRANDGPTTWDNLSAACRSCNARKHTDSLLHFLLKQPS